MKIFFDPKFYTLLIDTVVSLVLYFAGKYAAPGVFDDIKVVITALQPIFLAVVVWLYQKQEATMRMNGGIPKFLR